eukprot:358509-Chlamydomonas_euryale.AAC.3
MLPSLASGNGGHSGKWMIGVPERRGVDDCGENSEDGRTSAFQRRGRLLATLCRPGAGQECCRTLAHSHSAFRGGPPIDRFDWRIYGNGGMAACGRMSSSIAGA